MSGIVQCGYDLAWVGPCPTLVEYESGFCSAHENKKCVSCGAAAVRECDYAGQFVCGYPLCRKCEHGESGRHVRREEPPLGVIEVADRHRTVGPAPVDDPAPYMSDKTTQRLLERGRILLRQEDAERRLTIAAQFMAAMMTTREGESRMDADLARVCLLSADALIARWKETT